MNTAAATIPADVIDPQPPRLLRLAEVLARTGMGRTSLKERIKAGTFPKPCNLGTIQAWVESEVTDWINARIRERDRALRSGGKVGGTDASGGEET